MENQKELTNPLTTPRGPAFSEPPKPAVRMMPWSLPKGRPLWPVLGVGGGVLVVTVICLIWILSSSLSRAPGASAAYTVGRGDLTISITENGNIKSRKSVDLKSDVEGQVTIISIVPEGTYISPEDVKNRKVLVELDSSALKEKYTQQQINCSSAEASYADAVEAYDIQANQNNSDIKGGEIKVKFALMDLQKQLSEKVTGQLILAGKKGTTQSVMDIPGLVRDPDLGGAALQKLRELRSKIDLAGEELARATTKRVWTQKLFQKKYVSGDDLKADELAVKSKTIDLDQAKTNLELYLRYDFPKDTEKLYSDYREAERELQRIYSRARSIIAQADARRKGMEASYKLQKDILVKTKKQLDSCVLRAPAPGLVVYGSSTDFWARQSNPIQAGVLVYQRQTILTIPDNQEMIVEFKVHETWVNKVKPGQRADIVVDAFPEEPLTGSVSKVAPLADPQNWFNPDLKVFTTEVSIDGANRFLKTGMSAKVKINLQSLSNVISIPVQSVVNQSNKKICYVVGALGTQPRPVQTGASNDNFIEITAGLSVGDKVLLNPPRATETASTEKKASTTQQATTQSTQPIKK